MPIRFFDMFAGIGGFRSGLEAIGGFECVGYCEIDPYARKAYEALYDTRGEKFYEDATKIIPEQLPDFELLCGGAFPARAFRSPVPDEDLRILVEHCFLKWRELLPLKDLSICTLRTFPACLKRDVLSGEIKPNRI